MSSPDIQRARALGLLFLLLGPLEPIGRAEPIYVIAIGNNAPALAGPDIAALSPLRYADDDAAAFCDFWADYDAEISLLSVLDGDSQERFPSLVARARPPSWSELRLAVTRTAAQVARDRRAGQEPVVFLFFSGHGHIRADGSAALSLQDGLLTRRTLYDEVLAKIPASAVHLFVDSCHAEALVRPRGERPGEISAKVTRTTAEDAAAFLGGETLGRFPQVGAFLSSAADQEAHEWDEYGHGVFTHEVLSGLRGAADVNGDGRIEYSELYAFLSSANREVKDPRARLKVNAKAPLLNGRSALVIADQRKRGGWLRGKTGTTDRLRIEDERGARLLDLRPEKGFSLRLALPAGRRIFVTTQQGEAELRLADGETFGLSDLVFRPADRAARGSVSSAFREGLFATPFGPAYYRGFVDQTGLPSVPLPADPVPTLRAGPSVARPSTWPARVCFLGAGALGALAVGTGLAALDARKNWESTDYQRKSAEAAQRYDTFRFVFWSSSAAAVVSALAGAWLYPSRAGGQERTRMNLHMGASASSALIQLGGKF